MRYVTFVLGLAVATAAMSAGWTALRQAWETPTAGGWLTAMGYTAVFAIAFLYLGYRVYAADRAAGKVKRTIGMYERIIERRERVRSGNRGSQGSGKPDRM